MQNSELNITQLYTPLHNTHSGSDCQSLENVLTLTVQKPYTALIKSTSDRVLEQILSGTSAQLGYTV